MKKFISILLAVALLLCGAFLTYALAEAAEGGEKAAPLVDLTGVVVAVAVAAFDFLLAWIARVIVPPIKAWLGTHTTEKQRGLLWDAVVKLVDAAEQTIRGPGKGEQRLEYVIAGLMERGFVVDKDLIEAAVKQMNDKMLATFIDAFDSETDETGEKM